MAVYGPRILRLLGGGITMNQCIGNVGGSSSRVENTLLLLLLLLLRVVFLSAIVQGSDQIVGRGVYHVQVVVLVRLPLLCRSAVELEREKGQVGSIPARDLLVLFPVIAREGAKGGSLGVFLSQQRLLVLPGTDVPVDEVHSGAWVGSGTLVVEVCQLSGQIRQRVATVVLEQQLVVVVPQLLIIGNTRGAVDRRQLHGVVCVYVCLCMSICVLSSCAVGPPLYAIVLLLFYILFQRSSRVLSCPAPETPA